MRLPHGKLKEISTITKIPPSRISDYAAARVRPGRKRAKFLENVLKIKASIWLYGSSDEIKQALMDIDQSGEKTNSIDHLPSGTV